jgi:UrcA family protein
MTTPNALSPARKTLSKITLLMIGGIMGAASIGSASAASSETADVATMTVKYDPASLTSEQGARHLYVRLKNAADDVCHYSSFGHLVPPAVQSCRDQAVARAVLKINNPRLVAVYQSTVKNG